MNIQITEIPDLSSNLDYSKVFLANKVISSIKPLFDSIHIKKVKEIESLKNDINLKIETIKKDKKELTGLIEVLTKKKKISTILNRISALASLGILSKDINLKNDVISILKGIDLADNATLDKYLSETVIMITKRSTSK
jgi:hypothetical protein